ncbi:MAG: hypothetical protein E7478_08110, partial [Ruminococcaceae bacterium]|nr:hypothetical protein [Oscillospiraceae bacterium]
MKTFKKITSAVLAIASVLTITACEDTPAVSTAPSGTSSAPVTTASTTKATMNEEDASKVAEIDIGAKKLENGTVKFLSSWDINPTEGNPVPVSLEMFQTQFGGNIELVHTAWEERYSKLAILVQAD